MASPISTFAIKLRKLVFGLTLLDLEAAVDARRIVLFRLVVGLLARPTRRRKCFLDVAALSSPSSLLVVPDASALSVGIGDEELSSPFPI